MRNGPGVPRDAAIEDQWHLIGSANIEILAHDFFEETAPVRGRSSTWVKADSACRIDSCHQLHGKFGAATVTPDELIHKLTP